MRNLNQGVSLYKRETKKPLAGFLLPRATLLLAFKSVRFLIKLVLFFMRSRRQ